MSTQPPGGDPDPDPGPAPGALPATVLGGVRAVGPVLLGVGAFGVVFGAAAVEAGLGLGATMAFSLAVFAGAAQLAALELLVAGAPTLVAVVTALVINLRFLMYSASLAPLFVDAPLRRRAFGAFALADQSYAVTVVRFLRVHDPEGVWRFYLGAAAAAYLLWQAATLLGALVGPLLPEALPLDFAVPLMFLALLVPAVTDRPTLAAALVAAVVAVAAAGLPANLGMPLGAACGILTGLALGWRR